MIYQLPNGKIIEMSTEQFVEMTDEDIEYFIAYGIGDEINNPFFGSVLISGDMSVNVIIEELDLLDTNSIDKLSNLDLDKDLMAE